MLQQTQVSRVLSKYGQFIKVFPTFKSLNASSFVDILKVWQGLGYNRRAKYLKEIARTVTEKYHGIFPLTRDAVREFPGIGDATAGSIIVFAYNTPEVFIETNIRRVYIHFFFSEKVEVSDKEIEKMVEKTLDRKNPREWYYALMDYGAMLSQKVENPNKKSIHYRKQSPFENSVRQARGAIIKKLSNEGMILADNLKESFVYEEIKIYKALEGLEKEGMIVKEGNVYRIK